MILNRLKRRFVASVPHMMLAAFAAGIQFASHRPAVAEDEQEQLAAPVTSPVEADESLEFFEVAPGLEIELVASEPEVVDPVAIRFDERGRMWVVEMRDYPNGPAEGEQPKSRIKVLEDRDSDGRFETATVFADELLFATGVQPWRDGVIATLAGQVAYMKDTTGDGRADQIETWYTGFVEENPQLRANHPRLGLDNRIYVANGLRGGEVVDARQPNSQPVSISGMDFRFDPLSGEFEAVSGVGQFGLTFDDWGNRFTVSNRNPLKHVVLEDRYLKRSPRAAVSAVYQDVAKSGAESRLHAIARAWTTSNLHAGQFTAACGVEVFRGNALPDEFYGNGLTCDPTAHVVHREVISSEGASFKSQPGRDGVEFLASRDTWCSPVNLTTGPDGALYVVDMYRAVIEHPQFMPTELQQRPDLLLGNDRGRIYRVRGSKSERRHCGDISGLSLAELVALLTHPNAWQRETAQRLLVQRQVKDAQEQLEKLAATADQPLTRVHALWSLKGLNALTESTVCQALTDPNPRVREQAIVLAETWIGEPGEFRQTVARLCDDEDDRVCFQAMLSIAPVVNESELNWVWRGVRQRLDDVWTRRAARIAAGMHDIGLAELALQPQSAAESSDARREFVTELYSQLGRNPDAAAQAAAVRGIAARRGDSDAEERLRRLALSSFTAYVSSRRSLATILQGETESTRSSIAQLFAGARGLAAEPGEAVEQRTEAIELLAFDTGATETLSALLEDELQQIQIAAIRSLARHPEHQPWQTLLANFPAASPSIRRAVMDGVLANSTRTGYLLDEMESGRIKPAELSQTHTNRLIGHGDQGIRSRAEKLLADAVPADRQQTLADYQQVLTMNADPRHGKETFKKNCAACHRIGDVGVNVAPDISDSRTKTPAQILADIIQPNRAIDNNYIGYIVVAADGRVLDGILAAETATSITLRQAEGKTVTLLRSEIDEIRSTGVSLMPDGLEKKIPHQEMADLLSFIKNWRYLDGKVPVESE